MAGVSGATDAAAVLGAGWAPLVASPGAGVPHSGQKRNPGSMALPQLVQASGARVPQA